MDSPQKPNASRKGLTYFLLILLVGGGLFYAISELQLLNLLRGGVTTGDTDFDALPQNKIKRPRAVANRSYDELLQEGVQLASQGQSDAALEALQSASVLAPKEIAPYQHIADLYLRSHRYEAALKNAEFALNIQPQQPSLALKKVRALIGLRKILDAKVYMESLQNKDAILLYYQGLIASFLNQKEEAMTLFDESKKKGLDTAYQSYIGMIQGVYTQFNLAKEAPLEFLQAMLAKTYDTIGEYGLAIEMGFNALKTQHDYRDVWIIMGHAFLMENDWNNAEDALSKSISLDSSKARSYFYRGLAKKQLGKYVEAIEDFDTAVRLGWQPQVLAIQEKAGSYLRAGNYNQALTLYKEAARQDPNDLERFTRMFIIALGGLQNPEEARTIAMQLQTLHPAAAESEALKAWMLLVSNDLPTARATLEHAASIGPTKGIIFLIQAEMEKRLGAREKAANSYEKAYRLLSATRGQDLIALAEVIAKTPSQKTDDEPQPKTNSPSTNPSQPSFSLE